MDLLWPSGTCLFNRCCDFGDTFRSDRPLLSPYSGDLLAMVTLAFMEFTFILSSQLRSITGGMTGSASNSRYLAIDFSYGKILGVEFTGRLISYYLILILPLFYFF